MDLNMLYISYNMNMNLLGSVLHFHIDGLVQERCNSTAKALEL